MSATRRALQLGCHLAVLIWVGGALAWTSFDAALQQEALESVLSIEPRPEISGAAAQASPQSPAARASAASEPTRVGRGELADGAALLDGGGAFPALSCSYEDFSSFRDYARAMTALGARFVVVRQREIVGSVDLGTGGLGAASVDARFSPRARDYTGEPGLAELTRSARDRFGREAEVMMLVPRALDAGLFGGIARALAAKGDRPDAYREIRGRYQRGPEGEVRLRVDAGVRRDGERVPMDLFFDLAQIARLAAGAPGPEA